MDQEITKLFTSLAEAATKNVASAVTTRVAALKKKRADQEIIRYLEDVVTELLDEPSSLSVSDRR